MRVYFAAAVCTWGLLSTASGPAQAAEITDLASSFEKGKPFGFRLGAKYQFDYKTASITRESLPYLQSAQTRRDIAAHYGVSDLTRTEIVPDLLFTQRRQSLSLDLAIGLFRELQLAINVPLILRDERQFNLDQNAGWNTCPTGDWSCVANSSSTFLDGIYPIQPADQLDSGSLIFRPPVRGGSGTNLLDTINISLMGAPISQRRDPTKPTWVIGVEGQISVGTIMQYDNTRLYLDPGQPSQKTLIDEAGRAANDKQGWQGVSEGLHRVIIRTALSHRFKYVDPYLGLWYMLPIERKDNGSPWKPDYGFQQKHGAPQQKAGVTFGFEATPLENKAKGHRLAIDLRGGLQFAFLGRGYSEAWELFAASNALICDDQTALPPPFTYKDPLSSSGANGAVTQGTFNPACRAPVTPPAQDTNPPSPYQGPRLTNASAYYRQPYTGLTLIENYLTFNAQFSLVAELFRHVRLRLSFNYQRDQGHVVTQDDAGTKDYPADVGSRDTLNGKAAGFGCNPFRVDLSCPVDWNPAYRAVINQPGRRYRVDDVNMLSGSATLQAYW
jgi:hypothetical protein